MRVAVVGVDGENDFGAWQDREQSVQAAYQDWHARTAHECLGDACAESRALAGREEKDRQLHAF